MVGKVIKNFFVLDSIKMSVSSALSSTNEWYYDFVHYEILSALVSLCGSSINGFLSYTKGLLLMKVTFQTCCGVDVHKSFLVATIIKTTGGIEPSFQKR